jgi:hypothetical protein
MTSSGPFSNLFWTTTIRLQLQTASRLHDNVPVLGGEEGRAKQLAKVPPHVASLHRVIAV